MTKQKKRNIQTEHTEDYFIEININNVDKKLDNVYVELLLLDFFGKKTSPVKPVYVRPELSSERIDNLWVKRTVTKLQIAELISDPTVAYNLLADIHIQPYPYNIFVFIKAIGDNPKDIEKIETIVKNVISKMQDLKFEIESVKPIELFPQNLVPLSEGIPDHGADREILKMWREGQTNSEIGTKLSLEKRTVTNIISRLRQKHGKKIVPTNEQRRKLLLKK